MPKMMIDKYICIYFKSSRVTEIYLGLRTNDSKFLQIV